MHLPMESVYTQGRLLLWPNKESPKVILAVLRRFSQASIGYLGRMPVGSPLLRVVLDLNPTERDAVRADSVRRAPYIIEFLFP